MANLGQLNTLPVVEFDETGAYLDGGEEGDILLPRQELPPGLELGSTVEVFVYLDSTDAPIATTERPFAMVGDFALLEVVSTERVGAFLDWGLPKDLLLPFAEQTRDLRVGDAVIVALYLDKSGRISSSMRLHRYVDKDTSGYKPSEAVHLRIFARTDLGYKAIVNGRHMGILYADEVFKPLDYAEEIEGYIKEVRPDGKIDLMLSRTGSRAAAEDIGPLILEQLKANDGFLDVNDKTSAERIHELFGVSRKKFKIALGGLYKQRLIRVEDDGIYLV